MVNIQPWKGSKVRYPGAVVEPINLKNAKQIGGPHDRRFVG